MWGEDFVTKRRIPGNGKEWVGMGVAGAGITLLGVGLMQLMPAVVPSPTPTATVVPHVNGVRRASPPAAHQHVTAVVPNQEGLLPILYGSTAALAQQGQAAGVALFVPKDGVPGTNFEESYRSSSTVDILYNNMTLIEAHHPLTSVYRPLSSVGVSLANGTSATWEWIPGGGGPAYRLMFQVGSTYIRLQLSQYAASGPERTAAAVANSFEKVSANFGSQTLG